MNRIAAILAIVLVLALVISVAGNVRHARERQRQQQDYAASQAKADSTIEAEQVNNNDWKKDWLIERIKLDSALSLIKHPLQLEQAFAHLYDLPLDSLVAIGNR